MKLTASGSVALAGDFGTKTVTNYCVFCHGETGAGDGPVGYSYIPVPSDLRTAKVKSFSEGELLRAMLMGTGHELVLKKVILAEYRWHLELYTRSLGSQTP